MEGFYAVIFWWISSTQLAKQISDRPAPTLAVCEALLAHDIEARRKVHGNAEGYCLALPAKPAGLPEGPPVFKKPGAHDV